MWSLLAVPALAARTKLLTPTFAWPAGMDVEVVAVTEVVTEPAGSGPTTTEERWRVRTEAVADGLRVWTTTLTGEPRDAPVVVDARGRIVRAEGGDENTRERWSRLVETWSGATFEPGEPRTWTEMRALPLLSHALSTTTLTASWDGDVPCSDGERRPKCAALSLVVAPKDDAVTSIARRQLEYARAEQPGFLPSLEIRSATLRETLSLVADPATLVPRREVRTSEQVTVGEATTGPVRVVRRATTTVTWATNPAR
jgi:hypothetical protein